MSSFRGNSHTILCVSENTSWQALVENAANSLGSDVQVCCAPSGEAALDSLDATQNELAAPQICLVDHTLRDMSGAELLGKIHARSPRVASALVTDAEDAPEALEAINTHIADRMIVVSTSEEGIAGHIQALLEHHLRLQVLRERLRDYPCKHLFVTGATGFLGQQFLRDVLRCSNLKITALSRGRKGTPYDQRMPFNVSGYTDRLRFVEGDVQYNDLGLEDELRAELAQTIDEVWHMAAITSFDEVLREKTFAVNLEGTRRVIEFTKTIKNLVAFNHISTAYVTGDLAYPEIIHETLNPRPETFRNPYDESKFEAEILVNDSGLPYHIFRPSIILGERVSGRCDGQTVYNIAKMVRLAKLLGEQDCESQGLPLDHHSFRVVANLDAAKNMIPVDTVNHQMLSIRTTSPKPQSVFHITHPEPTSISLLVNIIAELLQASHYEIVDSLEGEELSIPEATLERVANVFRPYMVTSDPVFETKNVTALIGELDYPNLDTDFLRESLDAFYAQYFGADYACQPLST